MTIPTISERPVRREPNTGLLCQYPAFQRCAPSPTLKGHLIAVAIGALLAALVVFGAGQ